MPFTVSHSSVAIPLRKFGFSLPALVIGSMSPDFSYMQELFVPTMNAHNLYGLFVYCLPMSLIVFSIYTKLVEKWLVEVFPWIKPAAQTSFLMVALSLFVGAASHVLWDSFTHATGFFVQLIPALRQEYFSVRLFKALQHASTLLGGGYILWVIYSVTDEFKILIGNFTGLKALAAIYLITGLVVTSCATFAFNNPINGFKVAVELLFSVFIALTIYGVYKTIREN